MGILETFLGGNAISLVKNNVKKLFAHEAKKFRCEPSDLKIIINYDKDGSISIMTYSNLENKVWRIIPDSEAEKIIMKQ
jgi:hypothetical protein